MAASLKQTRKIGALVVELPKSEPESMHSLGPTGVGRLHSMETGPSDAVLSRPTRSMHHTQDHSKVLCQPYVDLTLASMSQPRIQYVTQAVTREINC